MNRLKQLIGEGRAIIASALCLLTCGLLAPSAVAAEKTAKAVYVDATKTMTFYYDAVDHSSAGTQYKFADYSDIEAAASLKDIPWCASQVKGFPTNVTFDTSFADYAPKSTAYWCHGLLNLQGVTGIENLRTSSVTNMSGMFFNCNNLVSLDVSGFDTKNVTAMRSMFQTCPLLTALDVSGFDTKNVTTMQSMFNGCPLLTALDVSGFDTKNVTAIQHMFNGCSSLTALDVSGFDTMNVTQTGGMFKSCSNLTTIVASESFKIDAVTSSTDMFKDCKSLVGDRGTKYDSTKTDKTYARIDGGPSSPGYFTHRAPNYKTADGRDWLYNHAIAGKACPDEAAESDVDLFYVYPTLRGDEKIVFDGFRGIDDETMRGTATNFMTAVGAYCNTARCFADMMHVYAPFYRQATLDTATDCATNAQGQVVEDANDRYLAKLCEGPAYADVTNALSTYFAKWNKGRKLVLAAHSQGSAILRLVMEKYFVENPDKAKLVVCSYQVGFGIGQASIDKIKKATGVTFATKADDTNVIVSYNTMGETASGNSVLLPPDTLAINPLSWSRGTDLADKDLNLGALTNALGTADVIVPHLYGAQVADTGENRGQVVFCKELNGEALAPCLFGEGSLHVYDYGAYWENLRANAYDRGGKLAGFAKLCTTNFPKHLCVGNATYGARGCANLTADPVGGTVWMLTEDFNGAKVRLVAENGYRLVVEEKEVSQYEISLYPEDPRSDGEFLIPANCLAAIKVEYIQRAPDYAEATGKDWLFNHDIDAKRYKGEPAQDPGVDLFYFYPTSVMVTNDYCVEGICDIDDPYLRGPKGATKSWNETGEVFGDFTHVYAPYYRQTPVDVEMSYFPKDGTGYDHITEYWHERAPYADVTNALTHYFTKINPDGKRPFVLAGHSHGAGMLVLAMEHFFADHRPWLKNMVACYAIGMGVSDKWEEAVKEDPGVTIATNATDAGVYVFWNTEGPGTSEKMISGLWPTNHVAGVNPITWTRTGEYAPASLNLGGWTADDSGAIKPGLYDASNNVAHGTVVCSAEALTNKYMDASWGFGEKSLHGWDYKIYWENLRANALQRIKTLKADRREPDYAQIPLAGKPIDYGNTYNWVTNTGTTKPLDVFYVYPTMMLDGDSTIVPVTDAMKEKAYQNAYVDAASAFAGYANVLIPAYRQVHGGAVGVATKLYTDGSDFLDFYKGQVERTDLFAALDYYFTNLNVNVTRPFILAGHSQGSCMLKIAFEDYFRSDDTRRGYLAKMVAAYPLGYSFSQEWCETFGYTFATNATDAGALISWNTEGPNAQERSFVIENGALAINPMNWTTNVNVWSETNPDAMIQERSATNFSYAAGTYALVTTNATDYLPTSSGMGEKSLHGKDWSLWYDQVKANGFTRYAAFTGFMPVSSDSIPTVADASWKVTVGGQEAPKSPVDGTYYVAVDASNVKLVYTLDAAKAAEGYYFADGTTEASFAMKQEGGAWVSTVTKAEIEAATKVGKPSVKLGAVAQRYPWNGQVDVEYKAMNMPANIYQLNLTVEIGGVKKTVSVPGRIKTGVSTANVDVKAYFGEVKGDVKVTAELVESPPQ